MRHRYLIGLPAALVVACGPAPPPVTEQEAAKAAAACFDWPKEIHDSASKIVRTNRPKASVMLRFEHAQTVSIDQRGRCSETIPTTVISNALRRFPPSSITVATGRPEDEGTYILFLLSTGEDGTRQFVGMKGGIGVAPLESPESQTPASPVT